MEPPRASRLTVVPIVGALGLIAGFAVAQLTGNRPAGGVVLVVVGAWCAWGWWRSPGWQRAVAALAVFAAAFAVSHPLGLVIGAWSSVITVGVIAGVLTWLIGRGSSSP